MKLAIIATRSLRPCDTATIKQLVQNLPADTAIVTGGRPGGEMVAARTALARGLHVHLVLDGRRETYDPECRTFATSVEELPEGTAPFEHAIAILDQVDGLQLILRRPPEHPASWHAPTSPVHRQANRRQQVYALMVLEPEDGAAPHAVAGAPDEMLTLPVSCVQTLVHQPNDRVAVVMTAGDMSGYALLVDGAFRKGLVATRSTWRQVKAAMIETANQVAASL